MVKDIPRNRKKRKIASNQKSDRTVIKRKSMTQELEIGGSSDSGQKTNCEQNTSMGLIKKETQ